MNCYINSKICFEVFRSIKVSGLDFIFKSMCSLLKFKKYCGFKTLENLF